jgi:hypothetical protein
MIRSGNRSFAASTGSFRLLRQFVVTAVAVCAVVVLAALASAEGVKLTDPQRKALMVYNFAKFTEWPRTAFADDKAPFVVGVLGKDPVGKGMDILKGRTVKGRNIEVKRFDTADQITNCHLLFISKSEMENLPQILKRLENSSILTTAEDKDFIEQNGIINLVPETQAGGTTQTVGFEVNLLAAEKANLKLDTQLLRLAKKVKTQPSPTS